MVLAAGFESLENVLFRTFNQFVEPFVRAGLGAPWFFPAGPIILETKGRKTGRRFTVPLMAALVGDLVIVSTVRRRSNWLKNLAAQPEVRYWVGGREREALGIAIGPDVGMPAEPPSAVRCLAGALEQHSRFFGARFAILMPRETSTSKSIA